MFGLTMDKLIVIGVLAAVLIGPKQLPVYAERLGVLVRTVRDLVATTKARAAEELGPEFDPTEWKRLDPRQFDPRRIIQEALVEERGPVAQLEQSTTSEAQVEPTVPSAPEKPVASGGWQAALLERVGRDGADAHRAPAPIMLTERVVLDERVDEPASRRAS
ncbi:Sec-independent protein translocase TatB [Plantibacter sp. PA-3-X8]|uniref:Sec-independent protein translocase TatB n=1 Tax=Plantibacter sp. PA-3-X8 TaxID=2480625 RepID=UPI000F5FCF5B|nr:Sec-independent protein translocase TatB [Plantibacter sp. PA-3-X8]AZH84498.1 Sec-independent protein translocase TatB [Plantibacter sp. PA-3-X8]